MIHAAAANLLADRIPAQASPSLGEDEINVKDLLRVIWHSKWLVLLITLALTAVAVAATLIATKKYEATIIVSPVTDESSGGRLSSLVSQVGSIGSLSGLSDLPTAANSQKSETVAVLQSETLTERFIDSNKLLPVLYPNKWDPARNAWKSTDPREIPTLWQANVMFKKKVRTIAMDSKSGLVTMRITWTDPKRAAAWANGLVGLTNDYLRGKAIAKGERNIAYLSEQAAKTDAVTLREGIYSILQDEIKKMMLARGSDEYALKIIDPAVPPERASSPLPVIWISMGAVGGFLMALLAVFVRHWWRNN
jgi:uncharacterized protein involved in exopolysaccharide biosynthesis